MSNRSEAERIVTGNVELPSDFELIVAITAFGDAKDREIEKGIGVVSMGRARFDEMVAEIERLQKMVITPPECEHKIRLEALIRQLVGALESAKFALTVLIKELKEKGYECSPHQLNKINEVLALPSLAQHREGKPNGI